MLQNDDRIKQVRARHSGQIGGRGDANISDALCDPPVLAAFPGKVQMAF